MTSVTHEECCPGKVGRTEECKRGEHCACLKKIPMHLRADKITFSQPNPTTPEKIPFGSENKVCLHDEPFTNELFPPNPCADYKTSEKPIEFNQKPHVKCKISGSVQDKARLPVHLGQEITADWTRFDVTSDIPGEPTFLPLHSISAVRSVADCYEGEQVEEEANEKCRCHKPFCRGCKLVESSSESLEEILVEKSVSFDDEMLDAADSEMWLNPNIAHKKVLQFTSLAAREKYKKGILKQMTHIASTTPRSEWIQHLHEFDHFVTIIMGESSSSSSDYGDSDIKLERKAIRKQRRKKRLMYSVDNMKEHPVYNCNYTRQYLNFMEDLKKRAAQPPTYEWPRFMKTFSGYGKDSSEEPIPEWMGLLMMAPTECFREISSSSSCESLPHLSDPGSTTTSLSSSECSPSVCGRNSTELLQRAGVCVAHDWGNDTQQYDSETYKMEDNSKSDMQVLLTQESDVHLVADVNVASIGKVPKVPSSGLLLSTLSSNEQPPLASSIRKLGSSRLAPAESAKSTNAKTLRVTRDSLTAQASAMLQSLQSNRQVRLQSSSKKLKAELLSEDDEIVVIQEEQLPTTLGIKPVIHGESPFEDQVQPEFQTTRRNVIVILHGKLHKLSYECFCGDICNCDPKQLVEKYMDLLIDEVYNSHNFESDEEEGSEFNREEQDSVCNQEDGILMSEPPSSRKTTIKDEDRRMSSKTIKVSTKIDRSRAFIRGLYVDSSPKDTPRIPAGKFDREDVIDPKAIPEVKLAYKDFHARGELRGANKCKKTNEHGTQSSKEIVSSEPGSEVFDREKHESESDDSSESSTAQLSLSTNGSSDDSIHLCACCKCEKRYEEDGKIFRRCDKKRCTCCNCKGKIIKVAKKIYERRKGSRFLYVVLKKIRRAINQPSKSNRENYLQSIVSELREEGRRMPKKKWPYYFKELMIMAGLESPSDETSISGNDSSNTENRRNKKIRRRRKDNVKSPQLTAAELQRREWLEWKAKNTEDDQPITNYSVPQRAVLKMEDMTRWENSEAYYEYLGFILAMNDVVKGHSCKEKFPKSPNVETLLAMLDRLSEWIDEIPPVQQPQRFGNKAFRSWLEKLIKEGPTILVELLPVKFHGGLGEAQAYLLEGFGNHTRIDYGTGHEMAFIMFLCCLFKIGVFTQEDQLPVVLSIFTRYLTVVRRLQTVYKMEPAGSRGVWALDDFQFIPFLWGSAQLIGHPHIRPSSFLKNDIVLGFHDHYMFLACIKYINENKIGPFAEHSNQLWNISAVPTWDKVNSGLVKMYKGEVLCKFPVIQHVLFGSILPITPAPPSQTERVYTGLIRDGLQPNLRPKPCMEPPPPPPPQQPATHVDPCETSKASLDESLAEKFQNVPDQDEKRSQPNADANKPQST